MFKADEEKHEKGHPHMPGEEKIKSDDYTDGWLLG